MFGWLLILNILETSWLIVLLKNLFLSLLLLIISCHWWYLNLPDAGCCRAVSTLRFGSPWRVLRAWPWKIPRLLKKKKKNYYYYYYYFKILCCTFLTFTYLSYFPWTISFDIPDEGYKRGAWWQWWRWGWCGCTGKKDAKCRNASKYLEACTKGVKV